MNKFNLNDGDIAIFSMGDDSPESQIVQNNLVALLKGKMSGEEFNRLHTDPRLNEMVNRVDFSTDWSD